MTNYRCSRPILFAALLAIFFASLPLHADETLRPANVLDEKCPAGSRWTKLTPGNRNEAEKIFENILIQDAATSDGLAEIDVLLNDAHLDMRTLKDLRIGIDNYFNKLDSQGRQSAIEEKIDAAISQAQANHPARDEMYICAPDDGSVSQLTAKGVIAIAAGQPTEEAGAARPYAPTKASVGYERDLVDAPGFSDKVRLSVSGSANDYTILTDGMTSYVKSGSITKGMPAGGDISNPSLIDDNSPFTDTFRSSSLPVVQLTLSDIIALGADGQHRVTLQFGEGSETSATIDYKVNGTTIEFKAFSGASASKKALLPDGHDINSEQIMVNQGIGEHVQVGAAYTDQETPTAEASAKTDKNNDKGNNKGNGNNGQQDKMEDLATQNFSAWVKTDNQVGPGKLVTRSVVGVQESESTHKQTLGMVEDAIYTLKKNRFIGEVVLEQETPQSLHIQVKPASQDSDIEQVSEFTLGYERTLYHQNETDVRVGGSYTREDTPKNFEDKQNTIWEGHATVDFNWSDLNIRGKKKAAKEAEEIQEEQGQAPDHDAAQSNSNTSYSSSSTP